jgi:hypothetical protein
VDALPVKNTWLKLDIVADLGKLIRVSTLMERTGAKEVVRYGCAALPSSTIPGEQPEVQICVTVTPPWAPLRFRTPPVSIAPPRAVTVKLRADVAMPLVG